MNKIILLSIMTIMLLVGCTKEESMTFEAQIESIGSNSIMVTTNDNGSFDKASVSIKDIAVDFNLIVGQNIKITILPEVRESYPVQVTATKVELIGATYKKITADQAKAMIDKAEYDIILDVRTLEEYKEGHIEGSTLLPDNEIKEKAEMTLLHKDETILVYCRSGRRSETAAKELVDMGYTNVYDFGGMMDWPYEVVKE